MIVSLHVTHFSDPGCPWAWSASPAIAALKWRYGDQLEWRDVMIGLTENGSVYEERGYTPAGQARGYRNFRERGMPFATEPRERVHGTWPMCRVVVATRRLAPEREYAVFRALQFAQFTSTAFLEDPKELLEAIAWVPGIDADAIIAAAERPRDRDALRSRTATRPARPRAARPSSRTSTPTPTAASATRRRASGSRTAGHDARGRRLPDLRGLRRADRQPRPSLSRRAPAEDAAEVLEAFPDGLTTAEVAQIMTEDKYAPDLDKAEDALIAATGDGRAKRLPFGHDALWVPGAPVALAAAA